MADAVFEPEVSRSLKSLRDQTQGCVLLAIECKKVQSAYLAFANVKDHQIAGLLEFSRRAYVQKIAVAAAVGQMARRFQAQTPFDFLIAGPGKAYLLVNFRFTKKAPKKGIAKGTNRCFAITPGQFIIEKQRLTAMKKASLPYEWFEENAIELNRIKLDVGYGWDLVRLM